MKLEEIKDPRLRGKIEQAIIDADSLKRDLRRSTSGPPSGYPPVLKTSPRPGKRIRQASKPLLNKLEQEYYDRFGYAHQVRSTHTEIWTMQSLKFKLANGLWYKPDFFIIHTTSVQNVGIEVKGPHAFRGGFENLKMAAHQYPWIKWVLVWKENGEWVEQVVLP